MVVHLIKLCVGVASVEQLEASWRRTIAARRAAGEPETIAHVTRMTPTRKAELAGGSLYWVIAGAIQCRSQILALEPADRGDGIKRCGIVMAPELIRTTPTPRRPFQGWRYLKPEDAPRDLTGPDEGDAGLPAGLRAKLMEIGAW